MAFFILFVLSGIMIAFLISAKIWQEKKEAPFPPFLRSLSLRDHHIHAVSEKIAHSYTEGREKTIFFVQKQLPLQMKTLAGKSSAFLKEKTEKYLGDVRGSRLLSRKDGLSEFFKNISEREQGDGRIDETFEE